MVLSTTASGTISQMARGFSSLMTTSESDVAPIAFSPIVFSATSSFTACGELLNTTQPGPFRRSRRAIWNHILPRPIIPICMAISFTLAPETPARRSCHRDKSDHVHPVPKQLSVPPGNVPVRTAFLQHGTQLLPKLFDGRSTKKPVAVVDLEYDETRFEDDDMRDHRIVLGVRVLGDVEILLNLAPRIG